MEVWKATNLLDEVKIFKEGKFETRLLGIDEEFEFVRLELIPLEPYNNIIGMIFCLETFLLIT